MKLINRTLLALTLIGWFLFFISVWEMTNYWAVTIWFLTMIAITAGYVLTKPSSIKTMTEDEPDNVIFSDGEIIEIYLNLEAFGEATEHLKFRNWRSPDWQECYEIAEKDELDREADKIIKEVSESCYRIGRGEADV